MTLIKKKRRGGKKLSDCVKKNFSFWVNFDLNLNSADYAS